MTIGPITAEISVSLWFFTHVRVGALSVTRVGPLQLVRCGNKVRVALRR